LLENKSSICRGRGSFNLESETRDEGDVHQLLVRAGLEEAVQPVGQPADGQRFAAAGGMVGQIFFADVARCGEGRRDVLRHPPHQTALVIAREDGGCRARWLVLLGLALRHADEEERQRPQQLVLRQHLAVKILDRILVSIRRRVGQSHVMPAEVLLLARVGGGHRVGGVGGEVEEGMLENLLRVVALAERRHGLMLVLVGLVLQFQRHDGQAVEVEDEINLVVRIAEVCVRTEGDAVLGILRGGGAGGVCSNSYRRTLKTSSRASVP
jgi:hypothetical protein